MKNFLSVLICTVFIFAACSKTAKHNAPADTAIKKTYSVSLMYNSDTGYFWYLENPDGLKMSVLKDEERIQGAFEETNLGNPYTQKFTFELANPEIKEETVVFKYKHYLEKDQPHSENVKKFILKPELFSVPE